MAAHSSKPRTGILVILDGFGVNADSKNNAVALAKTPTFDALDKKYPKTTLQASESQVGLPRGFMGNSEVGHLNIGAGRIVYQDFSLISRAIEDGSFFENPVFTELLTKLQSNRRPGVLHLMGLVSDGGVHSHLSHLFALLQLAKKHGQSNVKVHAFLDGRDTSPTSGIQFLTTLKQYMGDLGVGELATVMGRFYAMDRDNRWERTEKAYQTLVTPKSVNTVDNLLDYVRESYEKNITDEFVEPASASRFSGIRDGDGIIFFNFRADRARQISRAFTQAEFTHFRRESLPTLSGFVSMTPYDATFDFPAAYEKPKVGNTLGEVVSRSGFQQLRIAETEKYAHVTYFFNGGDETVFEGEKRVLIPSPRDVRTYDLKPEMAAYEVTDRLLQELKNQSYQFVVVNFANADMVGHTGNLRAAIKAVEVVDACVGKILDWVESHEAFAVVTADHGNCEKMLDDAGQPLTSHTLLPVPFYVVDPTSKNLALEQGGKLCDIAPTMLALWKLKQPSEMTGHSLLKSV